MKFYIYKVNTDTPINTSNLNSLNISNLRLSSNRNPDLAKPELIYNVESLSEPLQIINIKDFISQNTNSRIENISLYLYPNVEQDSSYGLSDEFDVLKLFNNKTQSTNFLGIAGTFHTMSTNKDSTGPKIYYKILNDIPLIKIIIEYYLANIDKILIEVSMNCSIYILKYILRKKLLIPENEQNLIDLNTQKLFKNDDLIGNLINPIDNTVRLNNSQINCPSSAITKDENLNTLNASVTDTYTKLSPIKFLKIQLIRKGKRRCSIGIDFSFNILKDIKKIDFSVDAPTFREASDGLNVFCYCKNKSCRIFEELFVFNLGCGKFDLIKEIAFIKCPICNYNQIEARNLGFINCEWSYRGYLTNKKNCCTSGDGLTIDDKLYILNEVHLNQHIEKLEILIKERKYIPTNIKINKSNNEEDSDGNIDYDSIGLESIRSCHYREFKIQSNLNAKSEKITDFKGANLNNNNDFNSNNFQEPKIKNILQTVDNPNMSITGDNTNNNEIEIKYNINFNNNLKTNFNLVKSKTHELEIITEKQPKFELLNCMSYCRPKTNKFKNSIKINENIVENIDKNEVNTTKLLQVNSKFKKASDIREQCSIF